MSIGIFLLIAGLFFLAYKSSVWFESLFHRLQLQLPMVKGWLITRQVNEFLLILALILEGGLSASEALPLATAGIKNLQLKKRFDVISRVGHSGQSISEILSAIDCIPATAIQMIHTGEISGRVSNALSHYTQHQRELIDIDDDALAKWIPRWFYATVVLGVMV